MARPQDEVLHLEVAVPRPLEPRPRLEAEALGFLGAIAVVRDGPEPGRSLGFDPVTTEVVREFETAPELGLGRREVVAQQRRGDAEVALGGERVVADRLGGGDRGPEVLDRLVELSPR